MTMKPDIHIFKDSQEVAEALTRDLRLWAKDASRFTVALSGGSTPRKWFEVLAQAPGIPWSSIHLYWGDERCVPPDHPESNFRMTQESLISQIDIPAENIHRVKGEAKPEEEAVRYSQEIQQLLPAEDDWPVFDLMVLGLGTDGHTASVFPDQMHLLKTDQVCAVAKHPESGQLRVTLTGEVLSRTKKVVFLVTGPKKSSILATILHHKDSWASYPASHIRASEQLLFYLDVDAAEEYVKHDT